MDACCGVGGHCHDGSAFCREPTLSSSHQDLPTWQPIQLQTTPHTEILHRTQVCCLAWAGEGWWCCAPMRLWWGNRAGLMMGAGKSNQQTYLQGHSSQSVYAHHCRAVASACKNSLPPRLSPHIGTSSIYNWRLAAGTSADSLPGWRPAKPSASSTLRGEHSPLLAGHHGRRPACKGVTTHPVPNSPTRTCVVHGRCAPHKQCWVSLQEG